jgi:ribosome maturation factor RimP
VGARAAANARGPRTPGSGRSGRRPKEVVSAVRPVAERVAADRGLVVWDVRFLREAGRDTLSVSCDRVGGVGSDELAGIAEDLGRELDHSDAVPGDAGYVLDVSSPGAERKLQGAEQFRICVGRDARVVTKDGRILEGAIAAVGERTIDLGTEQGDVRVFLDDVSRAQLVVKGIG